VVKLTLKSETILMRRCDDAVLFHLGLGSKEYVVGDHERRLFFELL
jgi:hypothetical protein